METISLVDNFCQPEHSEMLPCILTKEIKEFLTRLAHRSI